MGARVLENGCRVSRILPGLLWIRFRVVRIRSGVMQVLFGVMSAAAGLTYAGCAGGACTSCFACAGAAAGAVVAAACAGTKTKYAQPDGECRGGRVRP